VPDDASESSLTAAPDATTTSRGSVSVGPLDWTFLHVGSPVDGLYRAVDDGGPLVFTVPTARSPSASDHHGRSYAHRD
jgi:hypothetical protein